MTNTERVGVASVLFLSLCILSVVLGYWWANTVPSRPNSVNANAVFLWAPHVGLPAPRRGWWLACWEHQDTSRCRLSNVNGVTEFEGEFVPYGRQGPVASGELRIAARRTERAQKLWIGDALVPLVYLDSGAVLIPYAKFDEGRRMLDRVR